MFVVMRSSPGTLLSSGVQTLFPLLSDHLHLCVLSQMQDIGFLSIFMYLQIHKALTVKKW